MIKVGDRFETTRSGDCIVIKYVNNKHIIVEFDDEHQHRCKVTAVQLKRGWIKNPYKPLLFGVGYYGVGLHKSREDSSENGFSQLPAYSAWSNMLSRCYDKNYIDPHLYENSIVHEDWHCFQTFAEWYYDEISYCNFKGRRSADKDIMGDGTLYSAQTCCIVPHVINSVIRDANGGEYLPGIIRSTNGLFRVRPGYSCSNLRFNDEKSAHMAFVEAKSERVKSLANEHKEILRPHVYETLMTKDFRYKFSPFFEKPENRIG